MKILITGSHFTPAQATIEELKQEKNTEIVYVGRNHTREGDKTPSVESQILPNLGVKFIPITTGRIQKSFTPYTIPSLLKIPYGVLQAFYILIKEKPDVILSFGGYVAVPMVIVGWLLSIPIITHEQTLVAGLANRTISLFANKIAVAFANHPDFKGKKIVLTGNPIRKSLMNINGGDLSEEIKEIVRLSQKEKKPLILITGGNQGSHVINQAVADSLEELVDIACVVHQTGDSKYRDFENLQRKRDDLKQKSRYLVKKWIDVSDFGWVLKNCDLVATRAGINTLLELASFGVPSLVIPLPYLYRDEQNVNAVYFQKIGLATVLPQKELSGQILKGKIEKILENLPDLKKQAKLARQVVIPDAAQRLALETILLARKQK